MVKNLDAPAVTRFVEEKGSIDQHRLAQNFAQAAPRASVLLLASVFITVIARMTSFEFL
jgi:hypothetical protein